MPQKRDKNSEFAITLRERLTDLRKEKLKLTQTEFAKYVGISTSSVGLYETGERIPDAETLYKISSKCNVSTDYLLGISSVSTTDTEIKTICEYTGLAENVVWMLKEFTDKKAGLPACDYITLFNFFLSNDVFLESLLKISQYNGMLDILEEENPKIIEEFEKYADVDKIDCETQNSLWHILTTVEYDYLIARACYYDAISLFQKSIDNYLPDMWGENIKTLKKKLLSYRVDSEPIDED